MTKRAKYIKFNARKAEKNVRQYIQERVIAMRFGSFE